MQKFVSFFLNAYLFFLPWQTILITREIFLRGAKWEYATLGIYATEMLFLICMTLFIFWFWKAWKQKPQMLFASTRDRVRIASVALFIAYAYASAVWAMDPSVAAEHARYLLESAVLAIMLATCPISPRVSAQWFIAGMTIQSALGIFQFLSQTTIANALLGLSAHPTFAHGASIVAGSAIGRWLRAYGAFAHPNIFGGYLAVSLILTILLSFDVSRTRRFLLFIASLLETAALFFTFSRSAWIACLVFFLLASIHRIRKLFPLRPSFAFPSIALFFLFVILFYPLIVTRSSYASANEQQSITERISGIHDALLLFREHPILGVGIGNETQAIHSLHPEIQAYSLQPVHDVFILMLIELGIVGCFLAFLPFFFLYKEKKSPLILCLSLLPILLFDHYLFSSYAGLLLFGVFAGIIPVIHRASTIYPHSSKKSATISEK